MPPGVRLALLFVLALLILPGMARVPQAWEEARPVLLAPGTTGAALVVGTALATPGRLLDRLLGRETGGPPLVALTFDDGPYPMYTPALLDLLRRHGARATFFVTGAGVRDHPELARQIAEEGHELANHTFSHRREADLTPTELESEVIAAEREIELATGHRTRFFRPAGGGMSPSMLDTVGRLGYTTVLETVNAGDWWVRDPGELYRGSFRGRLRGGLVLMHSGSYGTLQALPTVLADLRAKGLRFVTMGDLARAR